MNVTVENISRARALGLLENVQNSICKGLAIGGKNMYEHINSDTCTAFIRPKEHEGDRDLEQPDFNCYTFTIQSGYWTERTLKEYAGIED